MSVKVRWYNEEQTILQITLENQWQWYDIEKLIRMQWVSAQSHHVDIIVDIRRSKALPADALTHFRTFLDARPVNTGQIVVVGANALVRNVYAIFRRVHSRISSPVELQFAEHIESAVHIINNTHRV